MSSDLRHDDASEPALPEIVEELEDLPAEKREKLWAYFAAYSGPLPLPSILERYDRLVPGAADRIIRMAEAQSEHRRSMEARMVGAQVDDVKAERDERWLGQILGFSIAALAIISGSIVSVLGYPWPGGIIGSSGVAGLAAVFVYGRKAGEKASESEAPATSAT